MKLTSAMAWAALAATLAAGPAAAGPEAGGSYSLTADLVGGSAGATSSGGTASVTGALGQTGHALETQSGGVVKGGFFTFPFSFSKLQILLPGQTPDPFTPLGRDGTPYAQVVNSTFPAVVRGVDVFDDQVDYAVDPVRLYTGAGTLGTQPLSAGATTFSNLTLPATGPWVLSAIDLDNDLIPTANSDVLVIVRPSPGPPSVTLTIAGSTVATLAGGLTGQAFDGSAVAFVNVALENLQTGKFVGAWSVPESFSSPGPFFGTATLTNFAAPQTTWALSLPDSALTPGVSYAADLQVSDPTHYYSDVVATFTFQTAQLGYGAFDGQGTASLIPAVSSGCQPVYAQLSLEVGAAGISPGGAVAVQLPQGWQTLASTSALSPPPVGEVSGFNTRPSVSTSIVVNPGSFNGVALGPGWFLMTVGGAQGFVAGDTITFAVSGSPPLGPQGRGPQTFTVLEQSESSGALKPVASFPELTLNSGTTSYLQFVEAAPLTLGPTQFSPVMAVQQTDLCGNPVSTTTVQTVNLSAGRYSGATFVPDPGSGFFSAATGLPATSVTISTTSLGASATFYYFTTNPDFLSSEILRADATLPVLFSTGVALPAEVTRPVTLLSRALALSEISVDTGPLAAGATSAAIVAGGLPGAAYLRFTADGTGVPWSLDVSTDPAAFWPVLAHRDGQTDATGSGEASWTGLDERSAPGAFVAPGSYKMRLTLGGGTVVDTSRETRVVPSGSIAGNLGAAGAEAVVSAAGPGVTLGQQVLASATGYFQVNGLQAGSAYTLLISTTASGANGVSVVLSASVSGVTATDAGTLIPGTIALPAAATFRVAVQIPRPAPQDSVGSVVARNSLGVVQAAGTLHFPAGSASSDNGGLAFGSSASTWTVLAVAPGSYELDMSVPGIGLSTSVFSAVPSTDVVVIEPQTSAVYGWAVLPATAALTVPVSVTAQQAGQPQPTVFGSAQVAASTGGVVASSAVFTLYGLSAGTWTIVAGGSGLSSAATTFYVGGLFDLGTATAPYVSLGLGAGAVVAGTVTVSGDSSQLSQCLSEAVCPPGTFELAVQAYSPATFAQTQAVVRLATATSLSSATFSLGGLAAGPYVLTAALPGFFAQVSTGVAVTASAAAPAQAALTLLSNDARLDLSVAVPPPAGGGCHAQADFSGVGLAYSGPSGSLAVNDITSLSGATETFHCSSMTALLPPLAGGLYSFSAAYGPTGASAAATFSLAAGTTTSGAFDLSQATFSVSGQLSLSGLVLLRSPGGYAVDVSSVAGALAAVPTTGYCLLGSSNPVLASGLHLELVPESPLSGAPPALNGAPSLAAGACGRPAVTGALVAAVATPVSSGTFQFSGVSPGAYWLRAGGSLQLDPADGPDVAPWQSVLVVTGPVSGVQVTLQAGVTVSGRFVLPPGAAASAGLAAELAAAGFSQAVPAQLDASGAADYVFAHVPDGQYTLSLVDPESPARWAAVARTVTVAGTAVSVPDAPMFAAATIVGRIALEQTLSGGATSFLLLTSADPAAWPSALQAGAAPDPWQPEGFVAAVSGANGVPALDSAGRFVIQGLPAGTYDVELNAGASSAGGVSALSTVVPQVSVAEGQTVDLGVVTLGAGVQLRGRVVDAGSGAGVANALVTARAASAGVDVSRARAPSASTNADGSGYYVLSGLDPAAASYDVTAGGQAAPGSPSPPYQPATIFAVSLVSTTTLNFALLPASFTVSGLVTPPAGLPLTTSAGLPSDVPGATLLWQRTSDPLLESEPSEALYYTAADGSFSVPAATGSYQLTVLADGSAPYVRGVVVSTGSLSVGTLALAGAASVSGSVLLPGGQTASQDQAVSVYAAASDLSDVVAGTLTRDAVSQSVTGYSVSGLKAGVSYGLYFISSSGELVAPAEASSIVALSTAEARVLNVVYLPPAPVVNASSQRLPGGSFALSFQLSQPLRQLYPSDNDMSQVLTPVTAAGALSGLSLSADRRTLSAYYTPGVDESSFTLQLRGYSEVLNPQSSDPLNPQLVAQSVAGFYAGIDAGARSSVVNLVGGEAALEGDPGRLVVPRGAVGVAASSSVVVSLQSSSAYVATQPSALDAPRGFGGRAPASFPPSLAQALAALPPSLTPAGPFYDVLLPAGVPTALAKPAQLTLAYSSGTDPSTLNVYWYNPASNAYVLQQDVTGAPLVVDAVNHTVTLNVNHFSTYALFPAQASVISGSAFAGSQIDAFNFPNPFDLNEKTVEKIHSGGSSASQTIRGTLIRFALPAGDSGDAEIRVFSVTGRLVRTIDMGALSGGAYYYQEWDGRNDYGLDVGSGVYIGQIKVGSRSVFIKMALIK